MSLGNAPAIGNQMIKELTIASALVLATTGAHAADWELVQRDDDATISADMSSRTHVGPIAKIWVSTVYTPAQVWDDFPGPIKSSKDRWIFNCKDQTHSTGTGVDYGEHDEVLFSTPGAPDRFKDVVPETVAAEVMAIACSKR